MPPVSAPVRPLGLQVSAIATWVLALAFVVMGALSLVEGHGVFSGGIAFMLVGWGVLVALAGWLLWRRSVWSRGLVVAAGLIHVLAFGQFTATAPWAVLGAIAGAAAVVGAVLPSTRAALTARG